MSPVNLVVSTIVEAENILPLLKEYQRKGRDVNVGTIFTFSPPQWPYQTHKFSNR